MTDKNYLAKALREINGKPKRNYKKEQRRLLRELCTSTGARKRLNRKQNSSKGGR